MDRRVVITGIGVVSPIGLGGRAFWDNLLAGQIGVRKIASFDPSGFASQIAGEVAPYKISEYVPKSYRKGTKLMARDIELAVIAADDCFRDAGIQSKAYTDTAPFPAHRFGCNIGAGLISVDLTELTSSMHTSRDGNRLDLATWGGRGMETLTPLWLLKYLPNMLSCHVTIIHELKGPSNTITCADASSHLAIGEAFRTIQRGSADLAICGGAETKVVPMSLIRQILLGRVTEAHNDSPDQAVRPFDVEATGTAVSEGAGLFIIESFEHARARNARIYAEIVGFGASQDTYGVTAPDPTGHSYSKAISKALADAHVNTSDVGLIIPHGLGIPTHDRAELVALSKTFGDHLGKIPMAPIKAQIGNTAAGSGVDAAAAVLGLYHGKIPPAVNSRKLIDPVKVNVSCEARDASMDIAVSCVYSLGGQNAALVFKRVDG